MTWTSISELLTVSDLAERNFYLAFCAHERWSKRTLRSKIASKLYQRTIAARGSAEGLEADLEHAILDEMQRFLLELGVGFAFVERQKRMTVDGRDYRLDLLFYHITMRCYVALELKTRPLEPGDYSRPREFATLGGAITIATTLGGRRDRSRNRHRCDRTHRPGG